MLLVSDHAVRVGGAREEMVARGRREGCGRCQVSCHLLCRVSIPPSCTLESLLSHREELHPFWRVS